MEKKGKIVCHECKNELSPQPGESYLILRKETRQGYNVTTHYYLCKPCLKQKIIPKCEEKTCKCYTCKDPDTRLKHLHYDSKRGGETSCLKCGIVFEEGLIPRGTVGHNLKEEIPPNEPKTYIPLVQQLANDKMVDWFNYINDTDLVIVSKQFNNDSLLNKYPNADLIFTP